MYSAGYNDSAPPISSYPILETIGRFLYFAIFYLSEVDDRSEKPSYVAAISTLRKQLNGLMSQDLLEQYDALRGRCDLANEAEFFAFSMLYKLSDDSNTSLLEYRKQDEQFLGSPLFDFILKISQAYRDNNYVKFFRLVRKATTMQGFISILLYLFLSAYNLLYFSRLFAWCHLKYADSGSENNSICVSQEHL